MSRCRCRDQCILSGRSYAHGPLDFSRICLSETSVWQKFTVSVVFNGCPHHVVASAHEIVSDLRRKVCTILLMDFTSCSPVLTMLAPLQANESQMLKRGLTLEDSKTLMYYGIINHTQLSISCPVPSVAPADAMLRPCSPVAVLQNVPMGGTNHPVSPIVESGVHHGAVIVYICVSVTFGAVEKKPYSFFNLPTNLSIASLKHLIFVKFDIPASAQAMKSDLGIELIDELKVVYAPQPIECHLEQLSRIFVRLQMNDGREKTVEVASACPHNDMTPMTALYRLKFLFLKRICP